MSDNQKNIAPLMEEHMGLVFNIVEKFGPANANEHDEFVQLGRIGLWKALLNHNPKRSKISTTIYHYVRYEILRHIHNKKNKDMPLINIEPSYNTAPQLWECIPDNLTDIEHLIIFMRREGYTFDQIAKYTNLSLGKVAYIYRKIINKIKAANE